MANGENGVHGAVVLSPAVEGTRKGHASATNLSLKVVENAVMEARKILGNATPSIVDVSKQFISNLLQCLHNSRQSFLG